MPPDYHCDYTKGRQWRQALQALQALQTRNDSVAQMFAFCQYKRLKCAGEGAAT